MNLDLEVEKMKDKNNIIAGKTGDRASSVYICPKCNRIMHSLSLFALHLKTIHDIKLVEFEQESEYTEL